MKTKYGADIPVSGGELELLQKLMGEMGILGPNSAIHIKIVFYDETNNALEIFFSC